MGASMTFASESELRALRRARNSLSTERASTDFSVAPEDPLQGTCIAVRQVGVNGDESGRRKWASCATLVSGGEKLGFQI